MAVDALRVQVLFQAIDRLAGPLRGMGAGAKGLKADIAATRREIVALEKASGHAGAFRKAENDYKKLGGELKAARLEAKAYRAEIAAHEKPTAAMTRKLEALERAEAKAGSRYQAAGAKLQQLGNELERTGVDVVNLAAHEDRLGLKLYETNKHLDQQSAKLERNARIQARAGKMRAIGDKISNVGLGMSLGITLPAVMFAKEASRAAIEVQQADAQVNAALASMGQKAGRNWQQLRAQASKLESSSLFDDDDIMRKVTANMLTFGNVSGEAFDRAQQAAVNMSARLGQDLQSSTIQVGKALNDPVKGLTALRRVGVAFDEQQQKTIKNLVKTGHLHEAQALMLRELEKEFGGAAKAQRDADPTGRSQQEWRTFKENVGAVVNILLPKLNALLGKALGWFNGLSPAMQRTVVTAAAIVAALGPVLFVLGKLISVGSFLIPLLARLGPLFLLVGRAALQAGMMMLANPIILVIVAIVAALGLAAYLIWKHWDKIKAAFSAGVAFVSALGGRIASALGSALAFVVGLPLRFGAIGAQLIQGLINGVTGKLAALKSTIVGAASAAANWFKSKLGIHSPSRVFHAFGGHIVAGLNRGIAAGEGSAIARVDRLSSRVAGAFAASSLIASPAMAGPSSSASRPSAAVSAPASIGKVEIHIHQQPGQSQQELARLVADELAKLQASSSRAAYHDE